LTVRSMTVLRPIVNFTAEYSVARRPVLSTTGSHIYPMEAKISHKELCALGQ
jgi:hypothetical protein